ncbi:MAG: radical SAM protein [Thermodesulfobacteriota bacterium]
MVKTLCVLELNKDRGCPASLREFISSAGFSDCLLLGRDTRPDEQTPLQLRGTGTGKEVYRTLESCIPDLSPGPFTGLADLGGWLRERGYTHVLRIRPEGLPLNPILAEKFWKRFLESGKPYGCVASWNAFLPGLLMDASNLQEWGTLSSRGFRTFPDGHLDLPGNTMEYQFDLQDRAFYLRDHYEDLFSTPHTLQIEVSSVCNSRCPKCMFHGGRSPLYRPLTQDPPFMEETLFRKIIDEFSSFRPRTGTAAALSYRGESLLHPRFFELVRYTRERGVRAVFNTNGALLTPEVSSRLLDLDVTAISLSVDSLIPAVHRRLQNGDIGQVVRNMDFLLEEKERRGLKRPSLSSISVISSENAGELIPLLGFLLTRFELVSYFHYQDILKRTVSAPHTYFDVHDRYPCPHPWEFLTVLSSGKVIRCGYDFNHEQILGDLNSMSVQDIWNGEAMASCRGLMTRGLHEQVPICGGCPRWRAVYKEFALVDGLTVSTQWEGKNLIRNGRGVNRETLEDICSDLPRTVFLPKGTGMAHTENAGSAERKKKIMDSSGFFSVVSVCSSDPVEERGKRA